jgi:hypothetical protein
VQLTNERQHVVERQAFHLQAREGVLYAAGLRPNAVFHEVFATAANAVNLLCEVHDLEPGGERAHEVARHIGGAPLHALHQLNMGLGVAIAALDGGDAVLLHEIQKLGPTLLQQDFADQRAERVHVLAKRFVLGREIDLAA